MHDEKFYEILSNYKFILSIENAICDDYVTEKLWRTYYVSSVPIVLANHERINDYLPTNKSIINVKDFKTAEDLGKFLNKLNENDEEYEKYLTYKNGVQNKKLRKVMSERKWGIDNDPIKGNFIDQFECLVCERIHENLERKAQKLEIKKFQATKSHYGCPHPITFDKKGRIITVKDAENASEDDYELRNNDFQGWSFSYLFAYATQNAFFKKYLQNDNYNFTAQSLRDEAFRFYQSYFVKNKSSKVDL
jgi:alpha-1,3-fucosyltransferase 10